MGRRFTRQTVEVEVEVDLGLLSDEDLIEELASRGRAPTADLAPDPWESEALRAAVDANDAWRVLDLVKRNLNR